MKHPEIFDFFPPDTGLETILKVWKDNPELYQFFQALSKYIEYLEEKQPKPFDIPGNFDGFRVDILPVPFVKKGQARLLVHPDNYPGKLEIKTDHGDLNVFHSKFIKHGEIGIMDLSYDPLKLGNIRPSECDILAYDDGSVSCCTCGLEGQSIFDLDCQRKKQKQ